MANSRADRYSNPLAEPSSVRPGRDSSLVKGQAACLDESDNATECVVEVDPQADSRWKAFVASHAHGLLYHHPAWLLVLEQAYGHRPVGLAYIDADLQIRGVLPLFQTRGVLTGWRLSSLPHTPVAGPLADDDHVTAALLRAAIERTRAMRASRLQLKSPQAGLDSLVDGLVAVPWETTYVLDLPVRPEELRFGDSRNHAQIKRAVNKASRAGVRVRPAETEADLRAWYQLYLETMRSHVIPPRSFHFFKVAWDLLQPRGLLQLLLAEQHQSAQRKLLAGSIFLMFGQTVFFAFNGRRYEDLLLRPNDAIHWHAIHEACRQGFRYYDLGEVAEDNPGLAQYKRKWGATPRQPYRYYYPRPSEPGLAVTKADHAARPIIGLVWQRLPLSATALLGTWLYQYL